MRYFHMYYAKKINQKISQLKKQINVSFEFFPPNSKKMETTLFNSITHLNTFTPNFISITCNANSKDQKKTFNLINEIKKKYTLDTAPHIICSNLTINELHAIGESYWNNGIRHIIALRGDSISGKKTKMYALDLVNLLKKIGDFKISVAAYPEIHPEAENAYTDLINLKRKIDAGANQAITQFFFDVEKYLRFRDRCFKIGIYAKIIPGILPIYNFEQAQKFSKLTNVHIPNSIKTMFEKKYDDLDIHKTIGAHIAIDMIHSLLKEGINDFHFYTLNRSDISYAICNILNLK